ncbi:MAG: sulfate permease [Bacteroidaceae bacterium]|nr:sulfate permease [Bacteroidaceae bacterium]
MEFKLKSVFYPKLWGLFKKDNYDSKKLASDLLAGVIVGIIALPLAIAFGIASGVTPAQGLITAIVAGFLISFFGGSDFLIGGPTGAFIVIVAGIVAQYGMDGLIVATIMAGVILILMGLFRLGAVIRFIPYPIVVGFTAGIAVTIFTTQVKDFLGLTATDMPANFLGQWGYYFTHLKDINWTEFAMSCAGLLVIIVWQKFIKKIPGSLIALIVITAAGLVLNKVWGVELATIGTKFPELAGGMAFPTPHAPEITIETVKHLAQPAFTIAILCAIESLLAAMVADGVTGRNHNSNTELIGEGIANIITPLFGGIPATGAIARTMASINNGGKSPVTGMVHAIVLLLIYLFLMPYAVYIPLSCLASILVIVAYNMSGWRTFRYLLRGDKADVTVLIFTFLLTVIIDLTVAIEFGVLLAIVLFIRRVMQTSQVKELDTLTSTEDEEKDQMNDTYRLDIPKGVDVYEINGPFFFGLASKIEDICINRKNETRIRIIRMRKVPFIDSTGINNLRSLCQRTKERGIIVVLSGVNPDVLKTLKKFGVDKEIGQDHIFPHIVPALEAVRRELETLK